MAKLELIGCSPSFQRVLQEVDLVGPAQCAVLIQGETGTGKEVIARAIHDASERRNRQFVAINCAAIPATLLESELFGHERGAFTGASVSRLGRFEVANKGTLFLDEIGELPLELQPKLLRAIQEQEFERLGSNQTTHVDVRIVAATNRDLGRMVNEHTFRADLYYRLNVYPIALPPLRERRSDIPLLAAHFMNFFAQRQGKAISRIPAGALARMTESAWPGNIRELQNFIERSVIMTKGEELEPPISELRDEDSPARSNTLEDANRAYILATLREVKGVVGGRNGAAARLGLPRTTLLSRMQKLGISISDLEGMYSEPLLQVAGASS
jgi:formate hydrogenlyase transcriptional activator